MHNTRTLKVKQLNGIPPSLILLFTLVLFLMCQNIFGEESQFQKLPFPPCPKLSGYLLPPVTISTPAPDSLINPSAHVPCSYTSLFKLHQAFLSYYLASLVFLTHACPFSVFVCLSVPFWTCLRPVADLCLIS